MSDSGRSWGEFRGELPDDVLAAMREQIGDRSLGTWPHRDADGKVLSVCCDVTLRVLIDEITQRRTQRRPVRRRTA